MALLVNSGIGRAVGNLHREFDRRRLELGQDGLHRNLPALRQFPHGDRQPLRKVGQLLREVPGLDRCVLVSHLHIEQRQFLVRVTPIYRPLKDAPNDGGLHITCLFVSAQVSADEDIIEKPRHLRMLGEPEERSTF